MSIRGTLANLVGRKSIALVLVAILALPPLAAAAGAAAVTPGLPSLRAVDQPWWTEWAATFDVDGDRLDDQAEAIAFQEGSVGVIVNFEGMPSPAHVDALAALGATDVHVFRFMPAVQARFPASALPDVAALSGVVVVEYDFPVFPLLDISAPATQARDYHQATGSNAIYNGKTAQALGYDGTGMVVAVLDTGINNAHIDFAGGKWLAGANTVAAIAPCVDGPDDDGHGTHVASTAVGNPSSNEFKGTAPGARLVEIKISASAGVTSATIGGIERGFEWILSFNQAVDTGGSPCPGVTAADRIDVATVSFGSTGRGGATAGSAEGLVNQLTSRGVTVTIAVGNCGPNPSSACTNPTTGDKEFIISSPGNAAGAIAVAASNDGATVSRANDIVDGYSSRGPPQNSATGLSDLSHRERKPEITAPGTSISAANGFSTSNSGRISQTGTSMATPHVAGLAAILMQAGESVKAQTGGVNRMAPTGPGYDGAGNWVSGQHPVRDALIHAADYRTAGVPADMLAKWEGPGAGGRMWNNGAGYGHANVFGALCWAWQNRLVPAGATAPSDVMTKCNFVPPPLGADAGGPYSATVGSSISLAGVATGGTGTYSYAWTVLSAPAGSTAAPTPAAAPSPVFSPDVAGAYTFRLDVADGVDTAFDTATLVASDEDAQGCGSADTTLVTDAVDDSTGTSPSQEALCLGADEKPSTFEFHTVVEGTATPGDRTIFYDFYFTPDFGLDAGEEQLIEVLWDGESLSAFWDVSAGNFVPDPSREVSAAWAGPDGNQLVVSFPATHFTGPGGNIATGSKLENVYLDVNDCGTGTTCVITTTDLVPDVGGATFTFAGGGGGTGGDGREVPLLDDAQNDDVDPLCTGTGPTQVCTSYKQAADIRRIGAGDDDTRLYFFTTLDDLSTWATTFYIRTEFILVGATERRFTATSSVTSSQSGAAIGLFEGVGVSGGPSAGVRVSQDLTVQFSGNTVRVGVLRSDLGFPLEGATVKNIQTSTTQPTTQSPAVIDTAGVATFIVGTPAPDSTPPTAPTGLVAFDAGTGARADLGWTAATDDVGVNHYVVYRDTSPGVVRGPATLVGTSSVAAFVDNGVTGGNTYYYVVSAKDAAGNEGPASNEASVTIASVVEDTTAPEPFALTATDSATDGEIALEWTASADPETGIANYAVHRSTDAGFTPDATNRVALLGAAARTYTSGGLANDVPYHFVVVAKNGYGLTTASNEATATPTRDAIAPAQVTGLEAAGGPRRVTLTWDAVEDADLASYRVYRDGVQVATRTMTDYADAGRQTDIEYCYVVTAVDIYGNEGPASAEACATPTAVQQPAVKGWPMFHRDPAGTGASPLGAFFGTGPVDVARVIPSAQPIMGAVAGNLDADEALEIVVVYGTTSSGTLMSVTAFDFAEGRPGTLVPKWTTEIPSIANQFTEGFVLTPVLVETGDGDDALEVFVAYNYVFNGGAVTNNEGAAAWIDDDGSFNPIGSGWIFGMRNNPVLGNVDVDAAPEIVLTTEAAISGGGSILFFEASGGSIASQGSVALATDVAGGGAPAIGDLDADGLPETVVATFLDSATGSVLIIDSGGTVVNSFPSNGMAGVALGDLDADGDLEIVATALSDSGTRSSVIVYATTGGLGEFARVAGIKAGRNWGAPTLGDVTGDGKIDIVVANSNEFIDDTEHRGDVVLLTYAPGVLTQAARVARQSPLADLESIGGPLLIDADGDGDLEIMVASNDGTLTGYDWTGSALAVDWTRNIGAIRAPLAAADVYPNGQADLIVPATRSVFLLGAQNRLPALDAVAGQTVAEGADLTVPVAATDADGDALTYTTGPLPSGATFVDHGDGTATFAWSPTFLQAGTYAIAYTVSDGKGFVNGGFDVVVTNTNRLPVLAPVGGRAASEGEALAIVLEATDEDTDDTLTFTASPLPPGASFAGTTFSWTPTFTQAGTYAVTFAVSDGHVVDSEDVEIVVADVDRAPVIVPIADRTVNPYTMPKVAFTVSASDPDGDAVTLAASNLPPGAEFAPANATFWWYPTPAQAGVYADVTFTATSNALSTVETLTITVAPNANPKVTITRAAALYDTSPGVAVPVTFSVRNDGLATDTVAFSATVPTGWTFAAPANVTLAKGESRSVTLLVTPTKAPLAGSVVLRATSVAGATASSPIVTVRLPHFVDLTMDFDTYFLTTPVTGKVKVTYLDGSPVKGTQVRLIESSVLSGSTLGINRQLLVTTGADGFASFSYQASPTGSTAPGDHQVVASTTQIVNPGSVDSARYRVV